MIRTAHHLVCIYLGQSADISQLEAKQTYNCGVRARLLLRNIFCDHVLLMGETALSKNSCGLIGNFATVHWQPCCIEGIGMGIVESCKP